jgi:hypothetical protein
LKSSQNLCSKPEASNPLTHRATPRSTTSSHKKRKEIEDEKEGSKSKPAHTAPSSNVKYIRKPVILSEPRSMLSAQTKHQPKIPFTIIAFTRVLVHAREAPNPVTDPAIMLQPILISHEEVRD